MNSPIKLPELPEPRIIYNGEDDLDEEVYDGDQMKEFAKQAVRDALAVQATALRNFADRKYCVGMDYAMRNEALGWVEKVRTGRYGEAEFACHQRMNQAFGAHVGIYEALKHLAPPEENNHE